MSNAPYQRRRRGDRPDVHAAPLTRPESERHQAVVEQEQIENGLAGVNAVLAEANNPLIAGLASRTGTGGAVIETPRPLESFSGGGRS